MSNTIYVAFKDASDAERAAGALIDNGIKPEQISLVVNVEYKSRRGSPEDAGSEHAQPAMVVRSQDSSGRVDETAPESTPLDHEADDDPDRSATLSVRTTTPEDSTSVAKKGALLGLGVGTIAALTTIAVPGFGLVLGGGALAAAVAGFAATTATEGTSGGIIGYLKDQGVPDGEIQEYETAYTSGGAILAIDLGDRAEELRPQAEAIVRQFNAGKIGDFGYAA